jgi:pimeloyl-ACP methyl ester carboxylesterase
MAVTNNRDNGGDAITRRDFVGASSALGILPPRTAFELAAATAAATQARGAHAAATPMPAETLIDRGFLRVREGLIHYRFAGSQQVGGPLPLYMAHAGPGSSLGMVGLMKELAPARFTVAPDMLGNGDSSRPAGEDLDMAYYAQCAVRTLDLLKIDRVDFYGSHTGAQIGCELAVKWPDRIGRLVLDGLPLFPEDFKQQLLANYAPSVAPDEFGGHLAWAWNFVRDQFLYWPHYAHDAQNRLANGLLPPKDLHLGVVDVLKALDTYHIAYRAAFAQDVRGLVPGIRAPVLFTATERDPLHVYLDEVARLLPGARKILFQRGVDPAERFAAIRNFLDG